MMEQLKFLILEQLEILMMQLKFLMKEQLMILMMEQLKIC